MTDRTLELCKGEARAALENRVTMESNPLYTQNYHDLAAEKTKWKGHLFHVNAHHRVFKYSAQPNRTDLNHLPPIESLGYVHAEYDDEITLMAGARAYFKVAFKVMHLSLRTAFAFG